MLDLSENLILHVQNLDNLELRTLCMAQNKLGCLEGARNACAMMALLLLDFCRRHSCLALASAQGVQTLAKLHSLDVRHNNITTIEALRAQEFCEGL